MGLKRLRRKDSYSQHQKSLLIVLFFCSKMKSLRNFILSLVLGMGSCSNFSSSPEGLEARVVSGSDIDLPVNNYGTSLPDPVKDIIPDTSPTPDSIINLYSPEIRSQQYFFTSVEDHYSFGLPFTGLGRLRSIKDFTEHEGLASQLVDAEGNFFSFCDNQDRLLEDVCELNLLQSGEAQLAFYKQNGCQNVRDHPQSNIEGMTRPFGARVAHIIKAEHFDLGVRHHFVNGGNDFTEKSSVMFILGFKHNFGDGLVPVYFNPDFIYSPSGP